jgi:hypothetical protein
LNDQVQLQVEVQVDMLDCSPDRRKYHPVDDIKSVFAHINTVEEEAPLLVMAELKHLEKLGDSLDYGREVLGEADSLKQRTCRGEVSAVNEECSGTAGHQQRQHQQQQLLVSESQLFDASPLSFIAESGDYWTQRGRYADYILTFDAYLQELLPTLKERGFQQVSSYHRTRIGECMIVYYYPISLFVHHCSNTHIRYI